jgi:hypothetical protein
MDLAATCRSRGFGLTGQACTATSRVIVEDRIARPFVAALKKAAQTLVVGDGLEAATQMGPAVSQQQLETDFNYISIGQAEGANLVAGGEAIERGGFFLQPTVFDNVQPDMRIAREEIFGPVIGILHAVDLEDAIEKANSIGSGSRWDYHPRSPAGLHFRQPCGGGGCENQRADHRAGFTSAFRWIQTIQRQHLQGARACRGGVLHQDQDDLRRSRVVAMEDYS